MAGKQSLDQDTNTERGAERHIISLVRDCIGCPKDCLGEYSLVYKHDGVVARVHPAHTSGQMPRSFGIPSMVPRYTLDGIPSNSLGMIQSSETLESSIITLQHARSAMFRAEESFCWREGINLY